MKIPRKLKKKYKRHIWIGTEQDILPKYIRFISIKIGKTRIVYDTLYKETYNIFLVPIKWFNK